MKKYWLRSLALSLGLVVASGGTGARAQTPIAATPTASLGRPVVIATGGSAETPKPETPPPPVANPGRQTVIASGGSATPDDVRPVSYAAGRETAPAVIRGQAADMRPMPVGPANTNGNAPSQFGWQRNDGVVATSRSEAAPPMPGPTLPAPTPMGAVGGVTPGITPSPIGTIPLPVNAGAPTLISGNAPGMRPGLGIPLGANPADCNCAGCAAAPALGVVAGPMVPAVPAYGPDPSHFVLSADYLLWWFKGDRTPPLAATAPADQTGLPNDAPTQVVYGGNSLGGGRGISGVRANAQWWIGDDRCWALDLGGFIFANNIDRFRLDSNGTDFILNRPVQINAFEAVANPPLNFPGLDGVQAVRGFISSERSSNLWGFDANARFRFIDSEAFTLDLLGGYRHLNLRESLSVTEFVLVTGPAADGTLREPVGTNFSINDRFQTRNRFNGAQVGFDARYFSGPWSVGLLGKFAMGVTEQTIDVSGATVRRRPDGTVAIAPGGLLALSTNSRTERRSKFSYAPELGVNVGYALTDWCRVNAGYNVLYWSSVARPGSQIDPNVNRSFVPLRGDNPPAGDAVPAKLFRSTDFLGHGFNFGLEFVF